MNLNLPQFLLDLDPNIYWSNNFVVLDFETTVKDKSPDARNPNNSLVTAAWCEGLYGKAHFVRGTEYDMGELVAAINRADFMVAHNTKFELKWLKRCGLDLHSVLPYCTQIGEYVYYGNRAQRGDLRLDALSKHYIGHGKEPYIDMLMRGGVCPSEQPASLLEDRNRCDIIQTREIFVKQRMKLHKLGLLPVAFTRNILTPALADIEMKGVHIDSQRTLDNYNTAEQELMKVEEEMFDILDGRNPASPKQMCELLYDVLKFKPLTKGRGKNKTEIRKADKDTIGKLKATTKKQIAFKELKARHARHNADVTKNLRYFKSVVDNVPDNVFYFDFNQTVTATHRLSSTGFKSPLTEGSIQGQNIPRKYKKLFSPRHEGWKIVEIDGAQLEFRVAAHIGRDVVACQSIIDGFDVHKFTASVLNNISQEDVSKDQRTNAKPDTFKPLYGGQYGTPEQMEYYKAFRERYPGITDTQLRWQDYAIRDKCVKTETGLVFYFPNCHISGSGYNKDFPNICNYPVQSLATADIIPIAITFMWHGMKHMEAFLTNTVHDSIIVECPEPELDELHEIGKYCFIDVVYDFLKRVYDIEFVAPLGIGFTAGDFWSEGEELETAKAPPYYLDGVDYSALEN